VEEEVGGGVAGEEEVAGVQRGWGRRRGGG
jgi:hypothetical protein